MCHRVFYYSKKASKYFRSFSHRKRSVNPLPVLVKHGEGNLRHTSSRPYWI